MLFAVAVCQPKSDGHTGETEIDEAPGYRYPEAKGADDGLGGEVEERPCEGSREHDAETASLVIGPATMEFASLLGELLSAAREQDGASRFLHEEEHEDENISI